MENNFEIEFFGEVALFTDPISKLGGEKFSYMVPTYESIKGMLSSIYWKPTFIWVIDKIRVMNQFQTETKGILIPYYDAEKSDRFIYTYLKDVRYQVKAHIEWNMTNENYSNDRDFSKHTLIIKRWINRGGKRNICLGTADCVCNCSPIVFGMDKGAFDDIKQFALGTMFHGFDYPNEVANNFKNEFVLKNKDKEFARFHSPIMKNGIIDFAPHHSELYPNEDGKSIVNNSFYIRKLLKEPLNKKDVSIKKKNVKKNVKKDI